MANIPNNVGPFLFEPRFTEEELRRRREEQEPQLVELAEPQLADPQQRDRNGELLHRLQGVIPVDEWCHCGGCRVPQNPNPKMCQCCCDHSALEDKMGDIECIVGHLDFSSVCLTPAVLQIVVNSMEEVRGYGINRNNWTNRLYRLVAYRSYTYWVYQRLGRYNRRVIPACVVLAIRAQFPENNDEDYVSYKEADEVGDAWHM